MGNAKFRNSVSVICKLHLNIKFGTTKSFMSPRKEAQLEGWNAEIFALVSPGTRRGKFVKKKKKKKSYTD